MKTDQNGLNQPIMGKKQKIVCKIVKNEVHQAVDFLVFKSKQLVFKIKTKIGPDQFWSVRRAECDFYSLRTILSLSFGQCFIPALVPLTKEAIFSEKSISQRQRSFSRFVRALVLSPALSSHPLILEFLKIDHFSIDKKNGLRDFSKKLQKQENDI